MSRGLKEATKELVENKHNKKLKASHLFLLSPSTDELRNFYTPFSLQKFCLDAEPRVTRLESDFATANVRMSIIHQ